MYRRQLKISREAVIFLSLAVFIFIVLRFLALVEHNIRPTVLAYARAKADVLANEAVNNAIREKTAGALDYRDFIIVNKDNRGRIVLAQVNNMKVNSFMSETTLCVKDALLALGREKIRIPLGQVFGSLIFANTGPKITVTLTPVGYVGTRIIDEFEEAGINQVRHKIYLEISSDIQVVIPFISDVTTVSVTVPLVDAIYPGEVPDTVINLEFPSGPKIPAENFDS